MKKLLFLLIALLCAIPAIAATRTLCNGGGCDGTMTVASFNTMVNSTAICGDTITLKHGETITINSAAVIDINRSCPAGQEILITTDTNVSRLPVAGHRITPGYLPLMPMILITGNLAPAASAISMEHSGVSGIIFRFVAIKAAQTNSLYALSIMGNYQTPTSNADLADNITWDRVLVTTDFDPVNTWTTDVFFASVKKFVVIDSYFEDCRKSKTTGLGGVGEGHHVVILNASRGPFTIRNNYFGGGETVQFLVNDSRGVPFQTGTPPDNFDVQFNNFYTSLRFYPGSTNYVGDANQPAIKNCFELKQGTNATVKNNQCENQFSGNYESQYSGFLATVRNGASVMGGTAALNGPRTQVTISNYGNPTGLAAPNVGMALGLAIVAGSPPDYHYPHYEYHKIIAADTVNHIYTVDAPYSGAVVNSSTGYWSLVVMPWGGVSNYHVEQNFLKNVSQSLLALCTDETGVGDPTTGLVFKNNITLEESPLMGNHGNGQNSFAVMTQLREGCVSPVVNYNSHIISSNVAITTNPTVVDPPYAFLVIENPDGHKHVAPTYIGNIGMGNDNSSYGGYLVSSGVTDGAAFWDTITSGALNANYNVITNVNTYNLGYYPTAWGTCTNPGAVCANWYPRYTNDVMTDDVLFKNPLARDFRLATGSPYIGAGPGGVDLGADTSLVPVIRNVAATPSATSVVLHYEPIAAISTLACSLEFSPNATLVNDDGAFALVAGVDPALGTRINFDDVNSGVIGGGTASRNWSISGLMPSVTYYYRIMCGGNTERGSVTTTFAATMPPTLTTAFNPNAIALGGTSVVTLTLFNSNGTSLTGAAFTDLLVGMSAVAGAAGGTCAGASTNVLGANATALSFSGVAIPANSSCTVTFAITSATLGVNPNTVTGITTTQTPTAGAPSNTATLTVTALAPQMTKALSPSTISIGSISVLSITIHNANPVLMTSVAFTDSMPPSLVITTPSGLTVAGCGAGTVIAAAGTGLVTLTGGTVQPGVDCVISVTVQGLAPGGSVNLTSTVTGAVQAAALTGDPATATLQVGASVVSYLVRYAANLFAGDSVVNLTNSGSYSSLPGVPNPQNGNLCANVYTYSPDEQLVSCCSCLVTPNALTSLSVVNDLTSNTLTPIRPSAVVIKLVASTPSTAGTCSPSSVTRDGATNFLIPGLKAWGSTLHPLPVTAGSPAGSFGITETRFSGARLSDAELTRMTQLCAFIQANGSGYGICKSCKVGGLGAESR